MTDLWICTTDMLNSISDKIEIKTDDYVYFELFATDKKHTKIGSVTKSYKSENSKNSHVKCIIIELYHDNFYMQICANENEQQILNKLSKLSERILKENMIIQIENI